ncbi:hypothetical protein EAO71_33985 [Streptomyces sp. ms191]|uniref:hypothetical protein n=1 Tax=Streptomyces sp. ms191 TaxID=1827978 RepID=UPI0011CE2E37|nr:hypothetical protein [Streptomyces sp. ms191]TXS19163.1 hypothetical protein EAO71_33985 [Streptomyces sp. ms191]
MGGDETDPVLELFARGTVFLTEPRRPILRPWHGPRMHLLAADGTLLGRLHEPVAFGYVLRDLADRPVLSVDLVSGRGLARPRFQVSDPGGAPIGEVRSPHRHSHTRLLEIRIAGGTGTLRVTRSALMGRTWSVRDRHDAETGRLTVSTARAFDGLQQYRVELDGHADRE